MQPEIIHTPMKKKKWIVVGVIVLLVLIVAVNITVLQSKKNSSTADLKFATASVRDLSNTKLVSGQIIPGNTETFYPDPTKGTVEEIYVKEDQQVNKGQKLFSYDNPDLSIQLKQLEIDKKTAQLTYDQGNTKIASLKTQIQNAKNANAGSAVTAPLESQLQDLQLQQQTTELQMEKNNLQEEDLQTKLNALVIYSGMAGIVQNVNKDAGQGISQAGGVQTTPVVQIASKDPFQVQGTLTELQKAQIQPNTTITVTAKAIPNKTWNGKITEISAYPTANDPNQTMAASQGQQTPNISYYNFKAVLNTQDGLSPGYHVTVQVELPPTKILAVPSSSIVENGNSHFVYVVKNNKVHKQTVSTGIGDGNWTEILQGVKAADKVIQNPSANVYDGLEVTVK